MAIEFVEKANPVRTRVLWDVSMMFRPPKSFFSTSSKDFLCEIDPLIILPKNVTGLEWMEGMKGVKSDGSVGDETKKE